MRVVFGMQLRRCARALFPDSACFCPISKFSPKAATELWDKPSGKNGSGNVRGFCFPQLGKHVEVIGNLMEIQTWE